MTRILFALALSCAFMASAGLAQADDATPLAFKKTSVMAMIDGKLTRVDTTAFKQLDTPYEVDGMFVKFTHGGKEYRVKATDTNVETNKPRVCGPTEIKVAQSNQKIGATQMGSGESACVNQN
ncbi:hypothetical protein [Hyphomonas johnsonii]|jgi:phage baseplate assembly protein gpV|uniref:Lipoprotein n=1 Tax=Hyphomonas johnsonii MHS-2 TaxID=1280950 RepID=A0A059FFU2_9PROT|nr:hypothetical protein [Hyphomonas johnsonii]KCZ89467.1 hypothetical protein HJO_14652 [Hyphomonas johnsonii MHS-2]